MMKICILLWAYYFYEVSTEPPTRVWMDEYQTCQYKETIFVKDDTYYLIHARQTRDSAVPNINNCEVVVGPYGEDRSLKVEFLTFYIKTCDVTFTITKGRTSTMLEERNFKIFDCNTQEKARHLSFELTEKNEYLKLRLSRSDPSDLDYNFLLNITSVPYKPAGSGGLSYGIKIGIGIGSVIAFCMILYLVYKTVRMKMSLKDDDEIPRNIRNLSDLSNSSHSNMNSYVPMPAKDTVRHTRKPDPEVYFEFNPSQSHQLTENGSTDPKTPPPPPSYDEAVQECVPLSEVEQRYEVEYMNMEHQNR